VHPGREIRSVRLVVIEVRGQQINEGHELVLGRAHPSELPPA
jgi:hypothetical protein